MKLIYRCLSLVLGAILGAGCSDTTDPVEYGPMPEYGVPSGHLVIDGTVRNTLGQPVPGIEVAFNGAGADTTDAAGAWSIDREYAFIPCAMISEADCTVAAEDIDGPANGGPYLPNQTLLDLIQTDPGSGSWDLGTWEQHGISITLTEVAAEYGPPPAKMAAPPKRTGK